MATSYTPPDVYVQQVTRLRNAAVDTPLMPIVLVGPAVKVATDLESTSRHTAGEASIHAFPNLPANAIVDPDSVSVSMTCNGVQGQFYGDITVDPADITLNLDASGNPTSVQLSSTIGIITENSGEGLLRTDSGVAITALNGYDLLNGYLAGQSFIKVGDEYFRATLLSASQARIEKYTDATLQTKALDYALGAYTVSDAVSVLYAAPTGHEDEADGLTAVASMTYGIGVYDAGDQVDILAAISGASATLSGMTGLTLPARNFTDTTVSSTVTTGGYVSVPEFEELVTSANIGDWIRLEYTKNGGVTSGAVTVANVDGNTASVSGTALFAAGCEGAYLRISGTNQTLIVSEFVSANEVNVIATTGSISAGAGTITTNTGTVYRDFRINDKHTEDGNFSLTLRSAENGTAAGATIANLNSTTTGIRLLKVVKGRTTDNLQANEYADYFMQYDTTGTAGPTGAQITTVRPSTLTVASELTFTDDYAFYVMRGLGTKYTTKVFTYGRSLTSGFSGTVRISYTADRRDLSVNGLMEFASYGELAETMGDTVDGAPPQASSSNPLGFAAQLLDATGYLAGETRVAYALATDGEDMAAFLAALDTLESKDVWCILPLTQDKEIVDACAAHATVQSQPLNRHERIVIGNTALPTYNYIYPLDGSTVEGTYTVNGTVYTLQSSLVDWSSVQVGNVIKSYDADGLLLGSARILSLNYSTGTATLLTSGLGTTSATLDVRVDTADYTKSEQAEAWRDESEGLANERLMLIRPDTVVIGGEVVPGYFADVAFAGTALSRNINQPMTNVGIGGIERLVHSADYFTQGQLNTIASGGSNILVQDRPGTRPYSRHQLMTDMTAVTSREWSIMRIRDYAAKTFRNTLRPMIGKYNITRQYLDTVAGTAAAILTKLINEGALLPGSTIESVRQNPDEPDSVIVEIGLVVPIPANRIYITLYI